MQKPYRLAIFDFDGTLVDSVPGILQTIKTVIHEHQLAASVLEQWSLLVGMPLHKQMEVVFPEESPDFHEKMIKSYRQHYALRLIENCPPFPGLQRTLDKLLEEQILLTIASSKSNPSINKVVAHHKLVDYFKLIIGLDDVSKHKPDPESVNMILTKYGIKASEAIVIGDSVFDIEMAKNAGVNSIAVTTGVHSRDELARSLPTHIVNSLEDILSIILC